MRVEGLRGRGVEGRGVEGFGGTKSLQVFRVQGLRVHLGLRIFGLPKTLNSKLPNPHDQFT